MTVAFAEAIQTALDARVFRVGDEKIQLTVSIGIAHVEEGGDNSTLPEYANIAMRKAKEIGKNQIHIYSTDG